MKCELYCDDAKRFLVRCGEQATFLWVTPQHVVPIPCCACHARYCPHGEIVSLVQPDAARSVTFLPYEAHA
jgi:hypothetical protein